MGRYKGSGFQAVPDDIPDRLSGFLERGRPRPLNPPLMQTQLVLLWFERRAGCIAPSVGPLCHPWEKHASPTDDMVAPRMEESDITSLSNSLL